jgi:glycine cleavage system H lipoate-binding protein
VGSVNKNLANKPEVLNSDPFGEGWMIKIENGAQGDLMDSAAYEKHCAGREH